MTAIEAQAELQARARRFVDDVLIPREEMAERAGGVCIVAARGAAQHGERRRELALGLRGQREPGP